MLGLRPASSWAAAPSCCARMSRHCCTGWSGETSASGDRSAMSGCSLALASKDNLELRVAERLVARVPFGFLHFQVGVQRRHVIAEDRDCGLEEIVDGAEPALARALLDERISGRVQRDRDGKPLAARFTRARDVHVTLSSELRGRLF